MNQPTPPDPTAKSPAPWRFVGMTLLTLALSAAGGLVAHFAGLPAGLIMGGSVAVAIAAVSGLKVAVPRPLRDTAFVLTGVSMGTNVARDSLTLIGQWPITLAGLAVELVLIVLLTGWILQKLFRLDKGTSYLSSFPGHLTFVMAFATAGVGDPRQIAIIQSVRILILVVCVPIGANFLPLEHLAPANVAPAGEMPVLSLILLIAACAATGWIFTRLRVPAGYVLGAMFLATAAKLMGLYEGTMPPWLLAITFIVIGSLIGSRLGGTTLDELRRATIGGIIATGMTVTICTAIAFACTFLVAMPFGQIWLGLSPGGLEAMGVMAVALGYDPAFVAAHHVARLLMLTFAIPLVVVLVGRSERRQP